MPEDNQKKCFQHELLLKSEFREEVYFMASRKPITHET